MNEDKCVIPVPKMSARIAPLTATGGGGTSDYNRLNNKPSINDIPLQGNKTLEELGAQPAGDYALRSELPSTEGLASETYVDEKIEEVKQEIPDTEGIKHDIENLTELVKENQYSLITSFTTGKPDGTGLVKISAVTKNGNIDAFSVYNNVDGKYPYSPLGAQAGKDLNDKITALQNNVLTKDNTTEYEPTTDYNPAPKVYVDRVRNDIPTTLSQLDNDLILEADGEEQGLTLSKQNPGKLVLWG